LKKNSTYLLIALMFLTSFTLLQEKEVQASFALVNNVDTYTVNEDIVLQFSTTNNVLPVLYCSNSYGSTLVNPTKHNNLLSYSLPKSITQKKGLVNWQLNNTTLHGSFYIKALQKVTSMETYIGPPSIEAGGKEYSMLVVIPTDSLDNPLANNTPVTVKHQFLNRIETENIYINNNIAYKNIYAPLKSGRLLLSSECLGKNSKEFTIIVHPTLPTNFTITANRNHEYADGNQITTFSSSIIKDQYNNIVSDGTFVTFYIKDKNDNTLQTTGTTIKGIATASMLHPNAKTTWNITAYVEGMAASNTIQLNYKQALKEIIVNYSEDNREIIVGPLQSFMKQMIPDGLEVELLVYQNNLKVHSEIKTSYKGFINFNLHTATCKKGVYTIKIKTADIETIHKQVRLW